MSGAFVMGLEDVDNRRRCGLEMERRRRCGVPVDDDQRSPHLRKIQGLKSKERGWRIKITATAPRTPQEAIRNENLIAEAQRVKTPNEGLKQQLHISEERCNPLVSERDSSDKRYNTLISEHEIQIDRVSRDLKRKYALEAESGDMYDALRERLAQALLRIEDLEHQVSREAELQRRLDAAEDIEVALQQRLDTAAETIAKLEEEAMHTRATLQTRLLDLAASVSDMATSLK